MSKQYGLIIPSKNKSITGKVSTTRPSVFNEDSDSDTPPILKPTGLSKSRKQDKITQEKALEEDPTVFQYDEIFDEMEQKKKDTKLARKDLDRKPKYINKLLAAADRRKRDNERRVEKQVQKEREAEGEEFKDKESFVTSAYKKKLEELKLLEEQEKREEYLEAIGDVTKQGNLDGFYRHLYDQKVNYDEKVKDDIKEEPTSDSSTEEKHKRKRNNSTDTNSSGDGEKTRKIKKSSSSKKRTYRSRKDSEEAIESEDEQVKVKKEHLPSNLDADSDFSIDSSSESDNDDKKDKSKETTEVKGEKLQLPEKGNVLSDNAALAKKNENVENDVEEKIKTKKENVMQNGDEDAKIEIKKETKPPKPKIDIWKKRTVGPLFDEAVKRYFERKAAREASKNG